MLHGYAVAHGMVLEARLSVDLSGLSTNELQEIEAVLSEIYGTIPEGACDFDRLIPLMRFDKKNEHNQINFTLINQIGSFSVNNYVAEDKIKDVLVK